MGQPVRIADVAQTMIDRVTHDGEIEIVYTGLREGEKLHEDLFGPDEPQDRRPKHPLVSHVDVPPIGRTALPSFRRATDSDAALAWMRGAERRVVDVPMTPPELLDEQARG
jgi:FlaA1/EpsC-like NDP-sugar epimerase